MKRLICQAVSLTWHWDQPDQVRSQGLDEATGQAIIVKKNGRANGLAATD